jgi:hypothetical protein
MLEDFNDQGDIICLELECMCFTTKDNEKNRELDKLQLSYHDKKKRDEVMA